jgi:hypothetical protein
VAPRGWAALLATAGWAVLLAPALTTYAAVGALGTAALAVAVAIPLLTSAAVLVGELRAIRRAPSRNDTVSRDAIHAARGRAWLPLLSAAVAALVLAGLATTLAPSASDIAIRDEVGVRIVALVPGPSIAWAVIVAASLTFGALVSRPGRAWLVAAAAVSVLAGSVFIWAGDAAAAGQPRPGACRDVLDARVAAHAVATGDVDGRSLGDVVGTRRANGANGGNDTTVSHATVWGEGTSVVNAAGGGEAFTTGALGVDARATADDLGLDRLDNGRARHCRMVVDGRTAIEAFPLLRWLIGPDPDAPDAGQAFIAWRGSLDYWVVRPATPGPARVRFATVEVSGPAPDWPVATGQKPALRATLRAASAYQVP